MHDDRPRFSLPNSDPSWTLLGLTPFETPDARLAIAFARAGGLALLDLGRDRSTAEAALRAMAGRTSRGFGIRIPKGAEQTLALLNENLSSDVRVIVVQANDARSLEAAKTICAEGSRTLLVQVTSIDEARCAKQNGAHGLIVKGHEAGGEVGDETAFVLLQRIVRASEIALPIWVQGGIGIHTAAACIAAGARGVLLDSQLALLGESSLAAPLREAI